MTETIDDLLRSELRRSLDPSERDAAAQRARVEAAYGELPLAPARRTPRQWMRAQRSRRSWTLAVAAASLATASLIAFALLPGSDAQRGNDDETDRLRLITATAGGAFAGLDVEEATAAEVLDAAGRSLAAATPEPGAGDWTYRRTESRGNELLETTSQRWTSPDGESEFSIIATTIHDADIGTPGRTVWLHYERLADGVIGDVAWTPMADGSTLRRATWHVEEPGTNADIDRLVFVRSALRDVNDVDDVEQMLDAAFADPALEFRGGSVCAPEGPCSGYGFMPSRPRMSAAQSERIVKAGVLLSAMSSVVLSGDASRAAYAYLAALPEARIEPASDETGDVLLSFAIDGPQLETHRVPKLPGDTGARYESRPVPGTTRHVQAAALIESSTGRIVQLDPRPEGGGISYRDVEAGFSTGPGIGGELCDEFPDECGELRDLGERLERDPQARFDGVLDWMRIEQFCRGLVDRDGTALRRAAADPGNDPSRRADHDACLKREAARAQGD